MSPEGVFKYAKELSDKDRLTFFKLFLGTLISHELEDFLTLTKEQLILRLNDEKQAVSVVIEKIAEDLETHRNLLQRLNEHLERLNFDKDEQ